MSAGMAGIIAAHSQPRMGFEEEPTPGYVDLGICVCGADLWPESTDREDRGKFRAAHVAEELTKAGYGNVQEALLSGADEMPIETLQGADKASVWLRQRAHSLDQEGRTLVQAIHERKAKA